MATNTGNGYRKGSVKKRSQTENPKTGMHMKRGEDGKFMAASKKPFKGVKREWKIFKKLICCDFTLVLANIYQNSTMNSIH